LKSRDYLLRFCVGSDCYFFLHGFAVQGKPSKAMVDALAVFGVSMQGGAVIGFLLADGYACNLHNSVLFGSFIIPNKS
jgi:hypothetical protein